MSYSPADLQKMRNSISSRSKLGQFCGSSNLFRNRYEILRVLGKGGFGVTFLVRDVALKDAPLCVIKQLCPKVQDPTIFQRASKRFEREAKMLRKLGDHPKIPKLLDYFEADGEFYLVQEYIRGFTLARQVRCRGPLSEQQVWSFLLDLMPILDYVHSQQVIHRDIKPPNLLRCRDDGRLVLIDFGAVKEQIGQLEQTTARGLTTHFIGTVGFAPPEQLALRPVFATDIYAVGVTCLYLLTAQPPAEFESDLMTGEIRWRDRAQVGDSLARIIDKMLQGSLEKRYRNVTEVLADLDPSSVKDMSNCLISQAPSTKERDKDRYLTPIERRAIAIRRWRDKLHNKSNLHVHSARVRKMISTSSTHPD